MRFLAPDEPDFDVEEWLASSEEARTKATCQLWVKQGFGTPVVGYLFYLVKIAAWVAAWVVFVARAPEVSGWSDLSTWWLTPLAFQKLILWTMLLEVIGAGGASGPLTGRVLPPVTAFLYWLKPGTIRQPAYPRHVPFTDGDRRTVLDVLGYAGLLALGLRALWSPDAFSSEELLPIIVLLPILGLRDKVIFLAARAEHYLTMLVVFLLAGDDLDVLIAGAIVVQIAIWWGAATSKLNHHFPSTVGVMLANAPWMRFRALRRRIYADPPDDLRPSRVTALLAHAGSVVEFAFPVVLLISSGGRATVVALTVLFCFHAFITSCFPMGVPLEWNLVFIYSMFFAFGEHAEVSVLSILDDPLLALLLLAGLLAGPVLLNLRPEWGSFLPAMRYYAGHWPAALWLFGPGVEERINEHVPRATPPPRRQYEILYGPDVADVLYGRVRAWRSMHVPGRALNALLQELVDESDLAECLVADSELIAGVVSGWNFGEGHLGHEQAMASIQARCGFQPGELRMIAIESQPINRPWMQWRYVDAAEGLLDEGRVLAADLVEHQPWPEPDAIDLRGGGPVPTAAGTGR